jgi:hypothetical protein
MLKWFQALHTAVNKQGLLGQVSGTVKQKLHRQERRLREITVD